MLTGTYIANEFFGNLPSSMILYKLERNKEGKKKERKRGQRNMQGND
jgi:hypothetical protein